MTADVQSELARIALALARSRSGLAPAMELVKETFGERAAIREYMGGIKRGVAEQLAIVDTCEILGVKYLTAK